MRPKNTSLLKRYFELGQRSHSGCLRSLTTAIANTITLNQDHGLYLPWQLRNLETVFPYNIFVGVATGERCQKIISLLKVSKYLIGLIKNENKIADNQLQICII